MFFLFITLFAISCNTGDNKALRSNSQDQADGKKAIDSVNNSAEGITVENPAKAREMAQEALLLAKKNNYELGIGSCFLNIGRTYWAQSYYPISLFYLNSALPYLQKTDAKLVSECYRAIGRNYVDLTKYDAGLSFLQKAIASAHGDTALTAAAIMERSYAYQKMLQYDNATNDIYNGIKLYRALHKPFGVAILQSRLFSILIDNGGYEKARAYGDTAYRMSIATKNKRLRSTILVGKAILAFRSKNYPEAIKYGEHAALLADSLGVVEVAANANKWLSNIYEAMGNTHQSLVYARKQIQLRDSINKVDKQKSSQLIQDYFSLNSKLNDIEQIQEKNKLNKMLIKSQNNTIINLTLFALALIISLYVLYRFYRQKKNLSKELAAQHQEVTVKNGLIETQANHLDELNQLKDRLLAIIGHDLRTPMANLRNIVDLFEQDYVSADEVQEIMKDIGPAIGGAELTLSNLVEWAGSQVKGNKINIAPVSLLKVTQEMVQVFKYPLDKKRLQLNITVEDDQYVMADENHVKMIFRNLISNAIKFTSESGNISISALPNNDQLTILITDSGKGMADEDADNLFSAKTHFTKTGTQGETGTGIGLLLCREMVELNDGSIGVKSILGKGSTFYITLPVAIPAGDELNYYQ